MSSPFSFGSGFGARAALASSIVPKRVSKPATALATDFLNFLNFLAILFSALPFRSSSTSLILSLISSSTSPVAPLILSLILSSTSPVIDPGNMVAVLAPYLMAKAVNALRFCDNFCIVHSLPAFVNSLPFPTTAEAIF